MTNLQTITNRLKHLSFRPNPADRRGEWRNPLIVGIPRLTLGMTRGTLGMTTLFFLLIIGTWNLVFSERAFAQSYSLAISPPLVQITIKPGKTITQVFKIENLSEANHQLTARIVPFLPEDAFGNPVLKPDLQPDWLSYFSLANALIRLNEPFTLKANKSDQLVLTVSIPDNATLADYYATLLVSSASNNTNTTGSSLSASIGSNILLSVTDVESPPTLLTLKDLRPEADLLLKLSDNTYLLDNLTPVKFTALAVNTGRRLTQTKGTFKIQAKSPVHMQGLLPNNILAQSERLLEASPSALLNTTDLIFKPSPATIGKFQAAINLTPENASAVTSEITLIFVPLKLLLAASAALILIITGLRFRTLRG